MEKRKILHFNLHNKVSNNFVHFQPTNTKHRDTSLIMSYSFQVFRNWKYERNPIPMFQQLHRAFLFFHCIFIELILNERESSRVHSRSWDLWFMLAVNAVKWSWTHWQCSKRKSRYKVSVKVENVEERDIYVIFRHCNSHRKPTNFALTRAESECFL